MSDTPPRKKRIEPEMLVGISAVFIGICALFVSLYETSLMRKEQRASVVPLLELSRSYFVESNGSEERRERLYLQVENVGIGPARIMDFRVTVDGSPKPGWNAAMQSLLDRDEAINYSQSTVNGRTVPPDRSIRMFDLIDTELTPQIIAEFDRLDFEACFCSVFDECWTSSYSGFGETTPVEHCRQSEESFRE